MIPTGALEVVREAYERGQRRYPTIDLPFERFLARVEEVVSGNWPSDRVPDAGPWLAAFGQLQNEDLFLATACARGDRIAWEYFADEHMVQLRKWAAQACRSLDQGEDLAQDIVTTLLGESASGVTEGGGGGRGRMAGYAGRGSLAAWLRVTVSRAAIDRFRRPRRDTALNELEGRDPVAVASEPANEPGDPDARWAAVLSRVLSEEIGRLPPRDRLLLGLYYARGVTLRIIGKQFGAHEATVSRWLDGIRSGLRKRVEKELRTRHGLRSREVELLWRSVAEGEAFSLDKVLDSG